MAIHSPDAGTMVARPRTRDIALASLLLGLLADQLVRVPGRPGLNIALWALAGTAVLWMLSRRRETPVSRETWWLVGGAVVFAGLLVLRDAEALAVFCLFSCVVLLGLAAGRGALAWARHAQIVEVAAAAVRVGVADRDRPARLERRCRASAGCPRLPVGARCCGVLSAWSRAALPWRCCRCSC